jgi:hypothetical protein
MRRRIRHALARVGTPTPRVGAGSPRFPSLGVKRKWSHAFISAGNGEGDGFK